MPSVSYYNQTGPFWDFVANLEEQGSSHPFFNGANRGEPWQNNAEHPSSWAGAWGGLPWGQLPHRGRHGRHGPHPPPPPPPPQQDGAAPPADTEGESDPEAQAEAGPSGDAHHRRHSHGGRDHHHGGPFRGRHGMGGRGGHWGRGRGRGHFYPYAMGSFGGLADMFQNQFGFNDVAGAAADKGASEFTPEVDVYDTTEAFAIDVSLPGAKKEDVAVRWDAEKSELSISGVVHRRGDEELQKTLAMAERSIGAFERKVRLGSRANPAQVDVDAISARMEDGVLSIHVPKLDAEYVEVVKVNIK